MACALTLSAKPGVDFDGNTGSTFTVTIKPLEGSSLRLVSATYGGSTRAGTELEFSIVVGLNLLNITYAAAKNGDFGYLTELCPVDGEHRLRRVRSTNDFNRDYIVEGV